MWLKNTNVEEVIVVCGMSERHSATSGSRLEDQSSSVSVSSSYTYARTHTRWYARHQALSLVYYAGIIYTYCILRCIVSYVLIQWFISRNSSCMLRCVQLDFCRNLKGKRWCATRNAKTESMFWLLYFPQLLRIIHHHVELTQHSVTESTA